jgi:glycosyltransferase involved in cell wall biosynthesis
MKNKKKLAIISNEKISADDNKFCCDNVDIKSIPEGLDNSLDVLLLARSSKIKRSFEINLKKTFLSNNVFSYLNNIFKTLKYKDINYLLISVTPYTFLAFIILFMFKKKRYVYLRSSGHEEYKAILGFLGPSIFNIMYFFINYKSNIISCQERLTAKKKYDLVFPSELDSIWLNNRKNANLAKPKLLYSGRIKVEKGIYSLLQIFNQLKNEVELSIVGNTNDSKIENNKINFLGFKNNANDLINVYDDHNIIILPSYTEAHPKVVDESLARLRPVIIFEEIIHIIQSRRGVFVAKRNDKSLMETIKFIMNNYQDIQNEMKKNNLPTKKEFIYKMTEILNK